MAIENDSAMLGATPKVGLDRSKTGRARGTPNKVTALLKDAIMQAAEASGEDGRGKGGLVGYCTRLANEEPRAFAQLLGKVLPMQIASEGDAAMQVVFRTFYEARPGEGFDEPPV